MIFILSTIPLYMGRDKIQAQAINVDLYNAYTESNFAILSWVTCYFLWTRLLLE